ncbi:MAG: hypothetical protein JNL83_31650 [Myxococcales bacterium]|nr:hypothetical protein [Myxococcales bacterium]
MHLRSSLIAVALAACEPPYEPIVICHNANCAGTGRHADDSIEGLSESLALRLDGRSILDGVELDTYLYWDGAASHCLFAHDDRDPGASATPLEAAAIVAEHLGAAGAAWNGERFYLKIELKPTVAGVDLFHTGAQLHQHAECAIDAVAAAVESPSIPVTVIFDSTSECLHDEVVLRLAQPKYQSLVDRDDLTFEYSGPLVPTRQCIPVPLDIRTVRVESWRDNSLGGLRPIMVWLDAGADNTEALKINRYLRPEYIATSRAQFVRGWITGFQ